MGGRPQPHGENKPCKKEKQPSASVVLANKEVTGNLFPEKFRYIGVNLRQSVGD